MGGDRHVSASTGGRPMARRIAAPGAQPWPKRLVAYGADLAFKFTNDCTMNLVSMVAFSVLTSFVSLILALVLVLSLLPGAADNVHGFAAQVTRVLPADVSKDANISALLDSIHSARLTLTLITAVGLLWGGTNLFGSIETAFAFVYRVKTRDILPQRLMALAMILLFVVLLPLSFVSSLLLATTTTTLGRIMPPPLRAPSSAVLGLAVGLFSLFLLFTAIYVIVPNLPVAWRHTWRGALVAASALWLVNTAFPFYAAHFIGTRQYGAATIGTVIITITWVWFFALVLLIGAQINALSMGLAPWQYDISRVLMEANGPFMETRYRRGPHRRHVPLPFSGLVRDSHKVRPNGERADTPRRPPRDRPPGHDPDRPHAPGEEQP